MHTENTEHLTPEEFSRFLETALPGQLIVYACGNLAVSLHSHRFYADRMALKNVAKLAAKASEEGILRLTQRRISARDSPINPDGTFEYRATRTDREGPQMIRELQPHRRGQVRSVKCF